MRGKKMLKQASIALFAIRNALRGMPFIGNLNLDATDACNQHCPMCNALPYQRGKAGFMTAAGLLEMLKGFEGTPIFSCSISGGEPTLVPEMPEIIEIAAKRFPFGFNLNTNLYAPAGRMERTLEAALRFNGRIDVSFDGFREIADRRRGAKNVSESVLENLAFLNALRKKMKSRSVVTLHTVLGDDNVAQIEELFEVSNKMGFRHTIAPAHPPLAYDFGSHGFLEPPRLTDSERLRKVIKFVRKQPNNIQPRFYLEGIVSFAGNRIEKICPYVSGLMRTYKVYLLYNGDLSFCDRIPLGNIRKNSFVEILAGNSYREAVERMKRCKGCWYICYVEPMIISNPFRLISKPKFSPSATPEL